MKADCNKHSRTAKDPLAPTDITKLKYWVLDDESLTFSSLQELEFALSVKLELSREQAVELSADGGFFGHEGEITTAGVSAQESARLAAVCDGQVGGTRSPGKAKAKATPKANPKAEPNAQQTNPGNPGVPNTNPVVKSETSLAKAKKMLAQLSTKVGDGAKLAIELSRVDAGPWLIDQINQCVDAMKVQHGHLDRTVALKISEPANYYDSMVDAGQKIIEYYTNRSAHAKALVNVTRRLEKEPAETEATSSPGA